MKKLTLSIFALGIMLIMIGIVSAVHTSDVEVSPSGWLVPSTSYDFEFIVMNTGGNDILTVTITRPGDGFSGLTCNNIDGWETTSGPTSCKWDATSGQNLLSGQSKNFGLTLTTGVFDKYNWSVRTIDVTSYVLEKFIPFEVQTIQNAINMAPSGGTVNVPAGVYNENVDIRKSIHLIGAGADVTTIEPSSGRVINIRAQEATNGFIDGITIQGFELITNDNNIVLQSNSANDGKYNGRNYLYKNLIVDANNNVQTAIGLFDVNGIVLDNIVVKNSARTDGGAIEMIGVKDFLMKDSKLVDNSIGLKIFDVAGYMPNEQIVISNTVLVNNDLFSVVNDDSSLPSLLVNAENNWWGTAIESEIQALVYGDVDYDPWWYDEIGSPDTTKPTITFGDMELFTRAGLNFTINATIIDDRNVDWYYIDFGDGNDSSRRIWERNLTTEILVNHSYNSEGKYTIIIWARDEVGNMNNNSVTIVITSEDPDWVIELSADSMNLISIPFIPEDTDYEEVFGGVKENLDKFWAYVYDEETKSNKWKYQYYDDSWHGSTGFNDIVPGYGYIVFMKNDDVLYGDARTISGDPDSEPELPASVKLANGYNLIGLFGTEEESVSIALSSLEFGDLKYWHKVLDVNEQEVTTLQPEKGYWLSMLHVPGSVTEDYYTYYP